MEGFKVFGADLFEVNSYWLGVYSNLLSVLSTMDMVKTIELINIAPQYYEHPKSLNKIYRLFESNGYILEGYECKVVTPWFIEYCKEYHKRNTEVRKKAKQDKIAALKKQIKELEKE